MALRLLILQLLLDTCSVGRAEGSSINDTSCFSHRLNTEIVADTQSKEFFKLQRFNKIKFHPVFEGCKDITYFLACSQKKFLSFGSFPLVQIQNYLDLPDQLFNYTLITNMYKGNNTITYLREHEFFYSNMNIRKYEKSLSKTKLYSNLDFNGIFSQQYSTKSGFVGLYQKKFILLETLPYNKTDDYLLYKDYDLTYMKFQDKLVSDKLDIIATA